MRSRLARPLAPALAGALVLTALVLLGRWEGDRRAAAEVRAMEATRALVGPLDSPSLSGYRMLPDFDCLVYRRGDNPYALELCVDADGRVVETIDRRSFERSIDSLRDDPDASTLRLDRSLVDRLLARMAPPVESGSDVGTSSQGSGSADSRREREWRRSASPSRGGIAAPAAYLATAPRSPWSRTGVRGSPLGALLGSG